MFVTEMTTKELVDALLATAEADGDGLPALRGEVERRCSYGTENPRALWTRLERLERQVVEMGETINYLTSSPWREAPPKCSIHELELG